ncbi:hypothetical protein ACFZC5_03710 [Nocardia gamkensis]|uniref:hypothetical protein n=1 Tax=Nocardia gamkensis TaxID=352869 RepID=UPI0036EF60F5
MTTLGDAEMWRHLHRNYLSEKEFRSVDQSGFISNIQSGRGPMCLQYLSASADICGSGDGADHGE